jgi:hypothetical protein
MTKGKGQLPNQAGGSGKLNAEWVETLMGFPPGWTDIGGPPVVEKPSTPGSPRARLRTGRRTGEHA